MAELLKIESVDYQVDDKALLRGVSLNIVSDTLSVILGPNGAGKTLLLQLAHGLITPTQGQVSWMKHADALGTKTMVFQKPVLLRRSVMENVQYAIRKTPQNNRSEMAMAALEWAGIAHLADRSALVLSAGEQQQVALARAYALSPRILFLDEPTANLDPNARVRVEALIQSLHNQGTKIIMTTHNLAQAQRLASDIAFINQGAIECHQENSDFFQQPNSEMAKSFIASEGVKLGA